MDKSCVSIRQTTNAFVQFTDLVKPSCTGNERNTFNTIAGGSLNPARASGPSAVFLCRWSTTWIYMLAEFTGGELAGLLSLPRGTPPPPALPLLSAALPSVSAGLQKEVLRVCACFKSTVGSAVCRAPHNVCQMV